MPLDYSAYIQILKEELVPAMGCTEPIAVAYGAAKVRELLGKVPEKIIVHVSGNIVKNVKSVIVPNTGGLKGIEASVAVGVIAGDAGKMLEVISQVSDEQRKEIIEYMNSGVIDVRMADDCHIFDIIIDAYSGNLHSKIRITDSHTNIVLMERDGKILHSVDVVPEEELYNTEDNIFTVADILEFADTVPIEDVYDIIERQIRYNTAISEEGLKGDYGANIGKTLLKVYGSDIKTRARAAAAAGSDARMSGCELPVIITSGSGNQGMTASLPVIEYAKELGCAYNEDGSIHEKLIRALLVSDLITLHVKSGIGRLSAYCGAVCAGCAAGAAISYMLGGHLEEVSHTLVNSLAIVSGIVCDGAKPSCAAKIASAVDAGLLGHYMYENGKQFYAGDGIVSKGVEKTIKNVDRLGRDGMSETDKEIIRIMLEKL